MEVLLFQFVIPNDDDVTYLFLCLMWWVKIQTILQDEQTITDKTNIELLWAFDLNLNILLWISFHYPFIFNSCSIWDLQNITKKIIKNTQK